MPAVSLGKIDNRHRASQNIYVTGGIESTRACCGFSLPTRYPPLSLGLRGGRPETSRAIGGWGSEPQAARRRWPDRGSHGIPHRGSGNVCRPLAPAGLPRVTPLNRGMLGPCFSPSPRLGTEPGRSPTVSGGLPGAFGAFKPIFLCTTIKRERYRWGPPDPVVFGQSSPEGTCPQGDSSCPSVWCGRGRDVQRTVGVVIRSAEHFPFSLGGTNECQTTSCR